MIAFIGVRISWLMAARNVRLGLVGDLGRLPGDAALLEQPGVVDGDRRLLGEAHQELQVARRERGSATSRQTAITPMTSPWTRAGPPSAGPRCPARARDRAPSAVGRDVVDDLPVRSALAAADDPLAPRRRRPGPRSANAPRAAMARKPPVVLGEEYGARGGRAGLARSVMRSGRPRSSIAEISRATSARAVISAARRAPPLEPGVLDRDADVGGEGGQQPLVGFAEPSRG